MVLYRSKPLSLLSYMISTMLLYMLLASFLAIEKLAYDDPLMNTKGIDLQYDSDLKGRFDSNLLVSSHSSKTIDVFQASGDTDHVMLTKAQYEELRKGGTIKIGHNVRLRAKAIPMPIGIFDTSKLSIFFISILLIVYGSFRALGEDDTANTDGSSNSTNGNSTSSDVSTLDSYQAIFLPLGASLSLLIMFLFFDSLQLVFAICTSVLATVAFAFLLLPMWKYLLRSCSTGQKISLGYCGRYTAAEMVSFTVSLCIVVIWIMTGHWLLMDALGMGLCVAFIALVRLPSLKVSTMLLLGLLVYDVFWVFISPYIFNANVMVKVATKQANNPVGALARKLRIPGLAADAPKLSLPGKLVFPSYQDNSHFSMLGLGDIVMPGLLLCFVMRYDLYKRRLANQQPPPTTAPTYIQRITYFQCSLVGYLLGLITATVISEVFRAAQPALLYLVPFTLLPLFIMAYLKGELRGMWTEPFTTSSGIEEKKKLMDV